VPDEGLDGLLLVRGAWCVGCVHTSYGRGMHASNRRAPSGAHPHQRHHRPPNTQVADPEDACSPLRAPARRYDEPWVALISRSQHAHPTNCTFDVKVGLSWL
jgi:hypothetical protein